MLCMVKTKVAKQHCKGADYFFFCGKGFLRIDTTDYVIPFVDDCIPGLHELDHHVFDRCDLAVLLNQIFMAHSSASLLPAYNKKPALLITRQVVYEGKTVICCFWRIP